MPKDAHGEMIENVENAILSLKKKVAFHDKLLKQLEEMIVQGNQYVSNEYLTRRFEEVQRERFEAAFKLISAESFLEMNRFDTTLLN